MKRNKSAVGIAEGEEAYLDVLSDLVKKYEDEHHPIPDASPAEVLKFLIEDRNTNQPLR